MFFYILNFYKQINFTTPLILNNDVKYEILNCIFWKCSSSTSSAGIELNNLLKNISIKQCGFYFMNCLTTSHGASSIYIDNSFKIECSKICFVNGYSKSSAHYVLHSSIGTIQYVDFNYSSEIDIGKNSRICIYSSSLGCNEKLNFYNSNTSNCYPDGRGIIYFLLMNTNSIIGEFLQICNSIGEGLITTAINGKNCILKNLNLINNSAKFKIIFNPWTNDNLEIQNSIFLNYNLINFHDSLKLNLIFLNCSFSGFENDAKSSGAIFNNCNFNIISTLNSLNNINTIFCWNLGKNIYTQKKNYIYNFYILNLIYMSNFF